MSVKQFVRSGLSRRSIVVGIACALIAGSVPAFAASDTSAKTFLEAIYQQYVGSSAGSAKGVPITTAKAVRNYFSVGLASIIIEDRTAASKRGEPPVLDGDPFVGHQDWDISNLAIDVKDSGAKAVGTVTFMNSGKSEKVMVELLRSGKDWRISDIEWDSGTLRGLFRRKAAHDNAIVEPQ